MQADAKGWEGQGGAVPWWSGPRHPWRSTVEGGQRTPAGSPPPPGPAGADPAARRGSRGGRGRAHPLTPQRDPLCGQMQETWGQETEPNLAPQKWGGAGEGRHSDTWALRLGSLGS